MTTEEDNTASKLNVTFEGPDIQKGASLDDFQKTLNHVQNAVRRMVNHLSGNQSNRGRPSEAVRQQSSLRIVGISPGSVVAQLELPASDHLTDHSQNYGQQAILQILSWEGEGDDSLPRDVAKELQAIGTNVSDDVDTVRLGNPRYGRSVSIKRKPKPPRRRRRTSETIEAILYGSLKEINWDNRTAQLHRVGVEGHVKLRFSPGFDDAMRKHATEFVKIKGRGKIDPNDKWVSVEVQEIKGTRSHKRPFDLEEFLSDTEAKLFDPDTVVRVSEPFDVDEFIRGIHDARDVESEWLRD